jgi:hypothetical protein
VESEVRNIFWKAGGELRGAELTVYKTMETTTIIRPERGEFCDRSAAVNTYLGLRLVCVVMYHHGEVCSSAVEHCLPFGVQRSVNQTNDFILR